MSVWAVLNFGRQIQLPAVFRWSESECRIQDEKSLEQIIGRQEVSPAGMGYTTEISGNDYLSQGYVVRISPRAKRHHHAFFFCPQKFTFSHYRFSTAKMAESEKMVLVSCIIDFDDIQVSLRRFSLSLNVCKVMAAFLIFSGQNLKKPIITW